MPFTLEQVVPWGRTFAEYQRMFALTHDDLQSNILGCGDGPASFNAEATRRGCRVVSCDPLYQFSAAQISERIEQTRDHVLAETRRNQHEFVWETIPSVEHLAELRSTAMNEFLADYDAGKAAGRYVEAALPQLPFEDKAFDLALCSHFLFLYGAQFDELFHLQSLRELARVACEVRVYPLLMLGATPYPHLEALREKLQVAGLTSTIETVPYVFQRGGGQMLRLWTD